MTHMDDEPPEVSPLRDMPPQPLPPRLVALEKQRANSLGGVDDTEPSPFATNSNAPSPFTSTGSVAAYLPNTGTNANITPLIPAFASASGSGTSGNVSAGSDGLAPAAGAFDLKLQGQFKHLRSLPNLSDLQHIGHNISGQNANYHPSLGATISASPLPMSAKSVEEQEVEADVLAALNYIDSPDPEAAPPKPSAPPRQPVSPRSPPTSGSDGGDRQQYQARSSFAPNSKSAERIANAEAHQAAKQESRSRPGRAKGKQAAKGKAAWASSDDEEEDDEDESDEERPAETSGKQEQKLGSILSPQPQPHPTHPTNISELSHAGNQFGSEGRPGPSRRLPAIPGPSGRSSNQHSPDPPRVQDYRSTHGHTSRPSSSDPHTYRRQQTEQFDEFGRRGPVESGSRQTMMERPQAQTLPNRPMWSTVLDPHGEAQSKPGGRDTFVQIEPNETMTMAFTPQGLLQVGMQDKQSRSAKQQEAHARETGASLINVPNPPPPPQMGLVGAITAHQRDREREGGVGAALTERERERRVAEERQRKYDEIQRLQLDKAMTLGGGNMDMQQGYNPMMMHPMMWGMGMPMMYPGMGWGGPAVTPQQQQQQYQMWAAQQAAMQAYQQTMLNLSHAGSQAPSEAGGGTLDAGGAGMPRGPSPMGGWGMGGMPPPMGSPMMSPMMMPGMGMMPGMMPGYGMGGSGFMQPPGQAPRSPINDDVARFSLAHTPTDSPQARSFDPSKPASRENYAS
jgi:CCR4-NOT transcriptional complex subunit CAF120